MRQVFSGAVRNDRKPMTASMTARYAADAASET
jgi:hypothetical protein